MRITSLVALTLLAAASASPLATRIGPSPVVVELFTSQGCSSCPPADELLRALARDPRLHGRVIPLAYHVDYWDRLGWRDPFSSADWSRRQMFYVRQLRLESAYTPQVIVNGSRDVIGNHSSEVVEAIVAASNEKPWGAVNVGSSIASNAMQVHVTGDVGEQRELVIVLYEDDVTTKIAAGENNGRTLVNDRIVRRLTSAGAVNGKIDKTLTIPLDRSWNAKNLGVTAFLQDHKTLAIHGAS